MPDILDQIMTARRTSVEEAKKRHSFSKLEQMAGKVEGSVSFLDAIHVPGRITVIAEMKRRSPSAGTIRSEYRPSDIALQYKNGGADALSVLTETDFFGGDVLDMQRAKDASRLPVLRKDFIFDPYQIVEAKAHGADAVLLIADMLDASHLKDLYQTARDYRLDALVEIFTHDVLEAALTCGARIIGINTRNLRTLEMRPDNIAELGRLVPKDRVLVAESGIKSPEDMKKMKKLGARSALIGESLLKNENSEAAVRSLIEAGKS